MFGLIVGLSLYLAFHNLDAGVPILERLRFAVILALTDVLGAILISATLGGIARFMGE